MDIFTAERFATLLGFLVVLLLAWLAVYLRVGGKALPVQLRSTTDANLEITGIKSLGAGSRAILLTAAGSDVLVVTHPKTGVQVVTLGRSDTTKPSA